MAEFNINTFTPALEKMVQKIAESVPDIMQIIAMDAKSSIINRIQQKGIDAEGNSLGKYSTKELPSFFFTGVYTKKEKSYSPFAGLNTVSEEDDMKSYKSWREENGHQTAFVDLTFTGDMWRQLQITDTGSADGGYRVTLGGLTDFAQDKIDFNSDRYKDILRISQKEEEDLDKTFDDEVQKIIDKNGFN